MTGLTPAIGPPGLRLGERADRVLVKHCRNSNPSQLSPFVSAQARSPSIKQRRTETDRDSDALRCGKFAVDIFYQFHQILGQCLSREKSSRPSLRIDCAHQPHRCSVLNSVWRCCEGGSREKKAQCARFECIAAVIPGVGSLSCWWNWWCWPYLLGEHASRVAETFLVWRAHCSGAQPRPFTIYDSFI